MCTWRNGEDNFNKMLDRLQNYCRVIGGWGVYSMLPKEEKPNLRLRFGGHWWGFYLSSIVLTLLRQKKERQYAASRPLSKPA